MKANYFNDYVCKNVDQLIDRLNMVTMDVINSPIQTKVTTNRLLKKSIPGLFQDKLARASIANLSKLHDFSSRTIWRAVHGPLIRVFFNTLIISERYSDKRSRG